MIPLLMAAALTLAAEEPQEPPQGLLKVRRVYVDKLNGGEAASQFRDILIGALQRARLFVITENPERADSVLRGAAEDLVFTEVHDTSEGVDARSTISSSSGSASRTRDSSRAGAYLNLGVGERESQRTIERKHEAMASVRLVDSSGDVIWSATKESFGAKFMGASVDVADKITRQLAEDLARAKAKSAPASATK